MPLLRFCLLMLPSMLLLYIDPLLPIAAYALQLWASSSFAWRDRWASTWAWTKQGGAFVALLLVIALLSSAHVWIIPDLTAALQAFWHAHLPGDLSLSPIDPYALPARSLLLLPLAPALALVYEWLDPRTRVQHQPILTPADLVEPKTETRASTCTAPTAKEAAPPPPQGSAKSQSAPKAAPPPRKRKSTDSSPQQITIEGYLASDKAQTRPPSPPHQAAKQRPVPPTETHPPVAKSIDWYDVAE